MFDTKHKPGLVRGIDNDGTVWWLTGKAGPDYVSRDIKDAFVGFSIQGARRKAARLNLHATRLGIRFIGIDARLAEPMVALQLVVWDNVSEERDFVTVAVPANSVPTGMSRRDTCKELDAEQRRLLLEAANDAYCEMFDEDNFWVLKTSSQVSFIVVGEFHHRGDGTVSTISVVGYKY